MQYLQIACKDADYLRRKGILWICFYGIIFAKKSNRKSNPIFPILSDFLLFPTFRLNRPNENPVFSYFSLFCKNRNRLGFGIDYDWWTLAPSLIFSRGKGYDILSASDILICLSSYRHLSAIHLLQHQGQLKFSLWGIEAVGGKVCEEGEGGERRQWTSAQLLVGQLSQWRH